MPNPLDRYPHDLSVIFVPPASPTDLRSPTAEEATVNSQSLTGLVMSARLEQGWRDVPIFNFPQPRRLSLSNGNLVIPVYPGILSLNTTITIPSLVDTISSLNQQQWIHLAAFGAEVGADQDPVLGQYSWNFVERQTNEITPVTKENTRRMRAFWVLVWSLTPLTSELFAELLSPDPRGRILDITDTSDIGFAAGSSRIYARDPNLTENQYLVFPEFLNLVEVCRIDRRQNHNNRGYVWGHSGEGSLSAKYHVSCTAPRLLDEDLETQMRQRVQEIFSGKAGSNGTFNRSVQNLLASSVGNNPGFPGESAGSPNGSVCLSNSQRVSFTNEQIVEKLGCQIVQAANDGTGSAVLNLGLNAAPAGTFFSGNRSDHRIFSAEGIEQSDRGNFSGLGTTGLVWIGDANATIAPGQFAYIAPGLVYPAGSGFSIPFEQVERTWKDVVEIPSENIREAYTDDLDTYVDPGSSGFFVVVGKERAALHYILRKVTITTSSTGVARIPDTEKGCFAFIEGVAGRIDAPIQTGLTPNSSINALVYYPPRATEVWQFLMSYPDYQGVGAQEPNFLSGSTIVSRPMLFAHTQGGGSSVHQGEGATRFQPIAMHLPSVQVSSIPPYRFNGRVQFSGEARQGPITLREGLTPLPAPGLILPAPGLTLSQLSATVTHSRSLTTKLGVGSTVLGFRTPPLVGKLEYQAVLSFVVEKAGERRLVVATRNTAGNENCALNTDQQTAIDIFRL